MVGVLDSGQVHDVAADGGAVGCAYGTLCGRKDAVGDLGSAAKVNGHKTGAGTAPVAAQEFAIEGAFVERHTAIIDLCHKAGQEIGIIEASDGGADSTVGYGVIARCKGG